MNKVSFIIRTYNEQRHLPDLLDAIAKQETCDFSQEVIVVDSGSTDQTLEIVKKNLCRIVHIKKEDFSFGRSLNVGCRAATGDFLVFVSAHCIPLERDWLLNLLSPLLSNNIAYVYGRQRGSSESRYSECQIFIKHFSDVSSVPQEGFFCNNANSALLRSVWNKYPFDEELTGLEDMHMAKRLIVDGMKIGYVAEATVLHLHDESWQQVNRRFEREAIALQCIMPEIHISFFDFLRYVISAILLDAGSALQERVFLKKIKKIVMYRIFQFLGSFQGNHDHRKISKKRKEQYFYPK